MELSKVAELKDNSQRADWAIKIFMILIAINVFFMAATYYEFTILESIQNGEYLEDSVYDNNDLLQGVIGLLHVIATITTIVLFLNWFRRAYGNVHRLGVTYLEHSETMAVWSFFIPIINLFRPYSIAKSIAEETREHAYRDDPSIKEYSNNPKVVIWWIAYVIMSIVNNFVFRYTMDAETVEELMFSSKLYLYSGVLDIITAILVIWMIKAIAKDEKVLFEKWKSTKSNLNLMDTFVDNMK